MQLAPKFRSARLFASILAVLSGAACAQAAFASNITVASPANGATTTSPVLIKAHNIGCNGVAPTAFGFSIDNSTSISWGATAYDIDVANQSISTGKHAIHFKAWANGQICPTVTSSITVGGSSSDGFIGIGRLGAIRRHPHREAPRRAYPQMPRHLRTWTPPATGKVSTTRARREARKVRPSTQRQHLSMTTLASFI